MIDSEEYRLGLLSPSIIIPEYLNSISIYLFNWRIYYSRCVTHQTTLNPDEIRSSATSMGDAGASSGTHLNSCWRDATWQITHLFPECSFWWRTLKRSKSYWFWRVDLNKWSPGRRVRPSVIPLQENVREKICSLTGACRCFWFRGVMWSYLRGSN